ncbi:hypothetical protein BJX70DRAFT_371016 [Aspergillus crustosus]
MLVQIPEYGSPAGKLKAISLGSQIGLLVGAAFWGLSADIIGRRFAFNASFKLANSPGLTRSSFSTGLSLEWSAFSTTCSCPTISPVRDAKSGLVRTI